VALIIPPHVLVQFAAIPRLDAQRLRERLERIAEDPRSPQIGAKPMAGLPGRYRVRQGNWRPVYTIKDGHVIVGLVGNRKEVY
jgi:mRNA-degrading endonuclease RelE of RelBE toxin-antitoxin system